MFRIWKAYEFAASHRLDNLDEGHPCARLHGHNYVVEIEVGHDQLNDAGMVLDYRVIDGAMGTWIKENLDHRDLNDRLDGQPSAEELARFLFQKAATLIDPLGATVYAVRVRETGKTCAEYRP